MPISGSFRAELTRVKVRTGSLELDTPPSLAPQPDSLSHGERESGLSMICNPSP